MKNKYDVIIIGAGLGGLLSANILSREGFDVCVIEKNDKIGGSIQSFVRDKTIFNTGLNYTESLGEGEVLNQYFKYFKIMDKLKIRRLNIDAFNKISFGTDGTEYPFAQGHNNFINRLSEYFPKERNNLQSYIDTLRKVCDSFPLYTLDKSVKFDINTDILHTNAFKYLESVSDNKKLQQVLSGMNPLYGAVAEKTPLYLYALINFSFIKSSWRLINGSFQLVKAISSVIKQNGGEIILSQKVVSIGGENKQAKYVELDNKERIYADKIISNLHPATTLEMVSPQLSKKIYKHRITSLENTVGMFTLYISLKDKRFPYLNFNHHYYSKENTWTANYNSKSWPEHYFLYTPAISKSEKWADGIIAMTYMNYSEVKKWENTQVDNRGEEYENFKQQKAEQLLNIIEKKFPKIRETIKKYYTSTPLTYRDYTATPEGSSYGILRDYKEPLSTIIPAKSRINNLYFTGQNLNLHGILGVTISAVLVCSEIVGEDYLIKKIRNE